MGALGKAAGVAANKAGQKAAEAAALTALKRGKTEDQKDILDFFYPDTGGCCGLRKSRGARMKMSEYQQLVSNRLYELNLRQRALDQIGLDESEIQEIPPIVLSGYVFDEDVHVRAINGEAVSSQFSVSWIFFSATQVYAYTYIFDMTSDDTWEKTQDFFYQDITCFTTLRKVVEKIDISIKGCLRKKESAEKNNYVVDIFEIIVPGTKFSFSMRNNDTIQESLQAAKAMLRERKYVH